jgi:hypothetical protein
MCIRDRLATLGVPAASLPAPAAGPAGSAALQKTYAEFSALSSGEKMKFSRAGGRLSDGPPIAAANN